MANYGSVLKALAELYTNRNRVEDSLGGMREFIRNNPEDITNALTRPYKGTRKDQLDLTHLTSEQNFKPFSAKALGGKSYDPYWGTGGGASSDLRGLFGVRPETLKNPLVVEDLRGFIDDGAQQFKYSVPVDQIRQLNWDAVHRAMNVDPLDIGDIGFYTLRHPQEAVKQAMQDAGMGTILRRPPHPQGAYTGNLDEFISFDPSMITRRKAGGLVQHASNLAMESP